ncbi:MAG TPA: dihydroorotate dehydrogenase electron transfer subunit [Candidatus Fournierella merdigallinarum]|nr:dihydroorotate dehydrogenase electron transfer subunit [Candidatus Fournierella merdigallinarum]
MPATACEVRVLAHSAAAPGIRLLTVAWPRADKAPHAGQFFMLRCWPDTAAPLLSRPISVHRWDESTGALEFLYEVRGQGTRLLSALEPGDLLLLTGPSGNGFDAAAAAAAGKVAVVGGGIGTAPLYQLVRELAAAGCRPDLYAGFRDEPYGLEKFSPLCRRVHLATDSGRAGYHGLVTGIFHPEEYDLVLCCGPEPMMKAVAAQCEAAGVKCLVSLEKKMACGVGACLGCTCHTTGGAKSVCRHGPVFDAKEVFGR